MSTKTTTYGLIKPELTDAADITAYNDNWDKIDDELKNASEKTNEKLPLKGGTMQGAIKIKSGASHGIETTDGEKIIYHHVDNGVYIGGTTSAPGEGVTSINSANGLYVRNGTLVANRGLSVLGEINIDPGASGGIFVADGYYLIYAEDVGMGIHIGGTPDTPRPGETSIYSEDGLVVRNAGITSSGKLTVTTGGANITDGADVEGNLNTTGTLGVKGSATVGGGLTLTDAGTDTLKSTYWTTAKATSSPNAIFDGNGGLRMTSGSSRRFKREIIDLPEEEANKVLDLRPVEFEFKLDEPGKKRNGFIAEEVYETAPQFADYDINEDGTVQCNNVRYGEITAALVHIIKRQQQQINELMRKVNDLTKEG